MEMMQIQRNLHVGDDAEFRETGPWAMMQNTDKQARGPEIIVTPIFISPIVGEEPSS